MKIRRLLSKFACMCAILSIVCFSCSGCFFDFGGWFDSFYTQINELYLKTDSAKYFYNLSDNYPRNNVGSCGYVSISMLLSYYDAYLNDDIIPEKYDTNGSISCSELNYGYGGNVYASYDIVSPGVKRESELSSSQFRNYADYYNNYLVPYSDVYFDLELMEMANTRYGYIDQNKNEGFESYGGIYDCYSKKIAPEYFRTCQLEDVLSYYLYNKRGFSKQQVKVRGLDVDDDNIYDEMKTLLDNNTPLLVSIVDDEGGGHVCILYDYGIDKFWGNSELVFYMHLGWDDYNHAKASELMLCDVHYLDFSLTHKCSNNYEITDSDGEVHSVCGCKLKDMLL